MFLGGSGRDFRGRFKKRQDNRIRISRADCLKRPWIRVWLKYWVATLSLHNMFLFSHQKDLPKTWWALLKEGGHPVLA